mgnify:FL=1
MLVALAFTAMVTIALVPVVGDLVDRQQARSAADAAALAGVTGGTEAAATLAELNGGELVDWSISGSQVTVVVRVGDQVATARATDGP